MTGRDRCDATIPTSPLPELLATKLRAYGERDKGRDLFDLWWANTKMPLDLDQMVHIYGIYMANQRKAPDSAPQMRQETAAKHERGTFAEVMPLPASSVSYDAEVAAWRFDGEVIRRLRNDDGTRLFASASAPRRCWAARTGAESLDVRRVRGLRIRKLRRSKAVPIETASSGSGIARRSSPRTRTGSSAWRDPRPLLIHSRAARSTICGSRLDTSTTTPRGLGRIAR